MEQKTNNKKYKYYEIKVSIRDTHPPVWRRLQRTCKIFIRR